MHTGKCSISAIFLALLFSGCEFSSITSATPDTGTQVYLTPGQEQSFTVTVKKGDYQAVGYWQEFTNQNGRDTQNSEGAKCQVINNYDNQIYSFIYAPDQESPGLYRLTFTSQDYYILGGETSPTIKAGKVSTSWNIVVKGIEVLPETDIAPAAGMSQAYEATAYPAGTYTYAWYLDDVQVGTGRQYTFTPILEQCGLHTLKVTAAGTGGGFAYSRRLIVPFAKTEIDLDWFTDRSDFYACADGGYVVAATAAESVLTTINMIGLGGSDGYIFKLDDQGNVAWRTLCGSEGYDQLNSIFTTTDGGYIAAGQSNSSGYIIKLNSTGQMVWQKYLSAGSIRAVRQASDGGFIAAGTNADTYDLWIVKLNASGVLEWERTIKPVVGNDNHQIHAIIGNDEACLVSGGGVVCKFKQSDGSTVWQIPLQTSDITPAVDSGYVALTGNSVIKLDETGVAMWQHAYTGDETGSPCPSMILGDADVGYVLAGYFSAKYLYQGSNISLPMPMVMTLDRAGNFSKPILIGKIRENINTLWAIQPIGNGKYMAVMDVGDPALYLVPVDINND